MIDYLRLVFGTVVVLLPGAAAARAFGQRSASALLAWGLAAVFVAWAAVFTLHRSINLGVAVLAFVLVAALVAQRVRARPAYAGVRASLWVGLGGLVLGWALWHVEDAVTGDGLFHEGRVRKLVDLTNLHLHTVDEFKDGGLHPGYAFPLWHGFLAFVSWFSGLDPETVLKHEPSVLAPLALLVAWEAGVAVFRSHAAGVGLVLVQVAAFCFAPGHGGSYTVLALPGTAARQLVVPAAVALFFASNRAATVAVFGALTLIHPTYALFLLLPLAGYALLRPRSWRDWGPTSIAALVPTGLALLWLRPVIAQSVSVGPGGNEVTRALKQYGAQLVVADQHHYRLAAEVPGRSGAVAVAGLLLLPVCALAFRRRWGAFALGGTLLVLALMLVPWLFVHFSDAVSLSQSRRAAGFAPLPYALVGALGLLARSVLALPVALLGGIVLQRLWPGDFALGLRHGGPAFATWMALVGGAAALTVAVARRPREPVENHRLGAVAALLLVAPVLVHGVWHWSPAQPIDPRALSPQLVQRLRTLVPRGAVVIAPVEVSYRIAAAAPLYVVAAPVTHVANTTKNRPYDRAKAVQRWLRTRDPAIPRRYGATWAVLDGKLHRLR